MNGVCIHFFSTGVHSSFSNFHFISCCIQVIFDRCLWFFRRNVFRTFISTSSSRSLACRNLIQAQDSLLLLCYTKGTKCRSRQDLEMDWIKISGSFFYGIDALPLHLLKDEGSEPHILHLQGHSFPSVKCELSSTAQQEVMPLTFFLSAT